MSAHFHLYFWIHRTLKQFKKNSSNKYLLDYENKKYITFHSHHLQLFFFPPPSKWRKCLEWGSLRFCIWFSFCSPQSSLFTVICSNIICVWYAGDLGLSISSQDSPLSSSLIHLTAHQWVDNPQQRKLNQYVSQLTPSSRPVPSPLFLCLLTSY